MKATGIVRRIDSLGRIVIPIKLRRTMNIKSAKGLKDGDSLEVYVDVDKIILKKYTPACIFCNNAGDTIKFKDKSICKECSNQLVKKS